MKLPNLLLALGAAGLAGLTAQAQWTGVDVGGPTLPGSATEAGGQITIVGGGADIWGTADQFHYYYKEVTGPFDWMVRVEDLQGPNTWSKAELMVRIPDGSGSPQAGDPFIANMATREAGQNGVEGQWRATRDGSAAWVGGWPNPRINPGYPDCYLRLQRADQVFNLYFSTDGLNWDLYRTIDAAASGFETFPDTVYLGLAVTAHDDGDANGATAVFSQLGELLDPTMNTSGTAQGFVADVFDSGSVTVDSIKTVKLDGADVTADTTNSKSGSTTTVIYDVFAATDNFFAPGSTHDVEVTALAGGTEYVLPGSFTVADYVSVSPDYAVASASDPGMNVAVYQTDEAPFPNQNSTATSEQHWGRGFPAGGPPWANQYFEFDPLLDGIDVVNFVGNFDEFGGDIDDTPADGPDNFNSALPAGAPVPNDVTPGIPGLGLNPYDNYTIEVTTFLQMSKGVYRMGVSPDDGFKVSVAPGQPGPMGLLLGQRDSGGGVADFTFDFVIEADGYYPFRLLYWQGGGGASCEWWLEDIATGERVLVNGPGSSVKAYKTSNDNGAHVSSLLPASGYPAGRKPTIAIELTDDATSVVDGSIKLMVDGAEVTPNVSKSGQITKVTWTPDTEFEFDSQHPAQLIWTESGSPEVVWTENFTIVVPAMGMDDFPEGTVSIDAEMFDYDGGQYKPGLEFGYDGSEYEGLGAVHLVDYYESENHTANDLYRSGEDPNVPMGADTNQPLDTQRPGFTMTTNHKIGWNSAGEWYNYTRDIPAGFYTMWSLGSHGTAGTSIGGDLSLVTEGVGTENQTTVPLASSDGPALGGWGTNSLLPSKNPDGSPQVFKLDGGKTTVRFTKRNGDYEAFFLVPVPPPPASLDSAPDHISMRRDGVTLVWTIKDLGTSLDPASLGLTVDGVDVSGSLSVSTDAGINTVTADLTATLFDRGAHDYTFVWADDGAPPNSHSLDGTFNVNPYPTPGTFVIEAEDFNYDGGQTVAAASTMPYLGDAYKGLDAVRGVDYETTHGRDAQDYRPLDLPADPEPSRNVNISINDTARYTTDRGEWTVNANYKVGWANTGNWMNYTRTIPQGAYEIWAAQAHSTMGGTDVMRSTVSLVTGDVSTADGQTVSDIGKFSWPGSGGWGENDIIPMLDADGNPVTVSLGGETTLRWTMDNGDCDYLLLVPTGAAPAPSVAIGLQDGQVVLTWDGGGTLQSADAVEGPYNDIPDATSPYPTAPTGAAKFFRIAQ